MAQTPRQEVDSFASNGYLRGILEQHPNGLSQEGIDLIVRVVINYCEPKKRKRKRSHV